MFGPSRRVARRTARRTSRRQMAMHDMQQGYDEPEPQYAPPPQQYAAPQPTYAPPAPAPAAAPDMDARIAQLTQLAALRDQGVLSPAEFEAQKARILAD